MKFGQLIEYNVRINFLKKIYIKYSEGTIPRTFSKKSKLIISLDNSLKFYRVCLHCIPS